MNDKLKPCPFCGNNDIEVKYEESISGIMGIYNTTCSNCGATFDGRDGTHPENRWNNRASGWISVKDRLPEENSTHVLAYSRHTVRGVVFEQMGEVDFHLDHEGAHWFYEEVGEMRHVTHWMPMPTPPEVV